MIEKHALSGFTEISHTADCALRIWAPDLMQLFVTAAEGMYELMNLELQKEGGVSRSFQLQGFDHESLLVSFLSELLFCVEEGEGLQSFELDVRDTELHVKAVGYPIAHLAKEIKAVTFHNLEISQNEDRLEVTVVFDV